MKIKLFRTTDEYGSFFDDIEDEINTFLEDHTIIDIKFQETDTKKNYGEFSDNCCTTTVLVIYQD